MAKTKKVKKVNPKDIAKERVMAIIKESLEQVDIDYEDGVEFGMTKGTIVVHLDGYDVQIKPIAPKAGLDKYEKSAEDGEIAE